jgi:hypothetical protein
MTREVIDLVKQALSVDTQSMREHPGAARRVALWSSAVRATALSFAGAQRFSRAATASAAVSLFQIGKCARRRCAPFVGRMREPPLARHGRKIRHIEVRSRRILAAGRTGVRQFARRHPPHVCEGATPATQIIIDRHEFSSSSSCSCTCFSFPAKRRWRQGLPPSVRRRKTSLVGPASFVG